MLVPHTGFTGSRRDGTKAQIESVEKIMSALTGWFHHGDCVGWDARSHNIARSVGLQICVHPPLNNRLRAFCEGDEMRAPKEYILRNHDIVT